MRAAVKQLERAVQAEAASTRVLVLPVLRFSTARVFLAWVEYADFRRTQRMILRRRELNPAFLSYRAWGQVTFPSRMARHSRAKAPFAGTR